MQLNLIFLDEPDLPLSQSLAVGSTAAWDQLDGASRLVALENPHTSDRPHALGPIDEGGER